MRIGSVVVVAGSMLVVVAAAGCEGTSFLGRPDDPSRSGSCVHNATPTETTYFPCDGDTVVERVARCNGDTGDFDPPGEPIRRPCSAGTICKNVLGKGQCVTSCTRNGDCPPAQSCGDAGAGRRACESVGLYQDCSPTADATNTEPRCAEGACLPYRPAFPDGATPDASGDGGAATDSAHVCQ